MRRRLTGSLIAAATLFLAACGSSSNPLSPAGDGAAAGSTTSASVVIGSANFPESQLLSDLYAAALRAKGVTVSEVPSIGSREVYLKALQDGSIDLIPEYNGALLAYLKNQNVPQDIGGSDQVLTALKQALPAGLTVLDQSAAQDKDTMTVTQETATKYHLTSIADLAAVSKDMTLAAAPEFAKRYQGVVGLKEVYGVTFGKELSLDAGGPLSLAALLKGNAQVADLFSTDSAIVTNHLVSLADPKDLFLSQNVLPLLRTSKATSTVTDALNAVSAKLTTANLTSYLAQVTVDKKPSATVASQMLSDFGLG